MIGEAYKMFAEEEGYDAPRLNDGELLIQILLNRMKKENPIMMDSLFVL